MLLQRSESADEGVAVQDAEETHAVCFSEGGRAAAVVPPQCVPAEMQTAKDSSRQDLMTRVISQWEECPQRQSGLSPRALISSRSPRGAQPLQPLPTVTEGQDTLLQSGC